MMTVIIVPHYIELIRFCRQMMRWKIGHKSHLHNQGEVLWTIYKSSISCYGIELLAVFEGDQHVCLPDEFYDQSKSQILPIWTKLNFRIVEKEWWMCGCVFLFGENNFLCLFSSILIEWHFPLVCPVLYF